VISVVLIVHLFRCGMCVCSMLKELISDRLKALKIEIAPSRMRIREQYNDRCTRIFDNHLSMEYIKTNYFYLLDRSLCVQDAGYDIPESVITSGSSAWLNTRHSYSIAMHLRMQEHNSTLVRVQQWHSSTWQFDPIFELPVFEDTSCSGFAAMVVSKHASGTVTVRCAIVKPTLTCACVV